MIFVSTGGKRNITGAVMAESLISCGINSVELSGGAYSSSFRQDLIALSKKATLQVHNYFPPPLDPFVFNLASADKDILQLSFNHILSAMHLAVELGRPTYSFHAGFRINPRVSELGKSLSRYDLSDKKWALNHFGENVLNLAEIARYEGVNLLVENNVLSGVNLKTFGEDPFLLTDPSGINDFMKKMPSNVRLLLDVAHLKVSSKALGFDLLDAHRELIPWISAYHLSDNDGNADTNQKIDENSWFWKDLKRGLNYYSLEIYGLTNLELFKQYELAKKLAN